MTDTPKQNVAGRAAAATGVFLTPMAITNILPYPYSVWFMYACVGITGLCYAATLIPVPANPTGNAAKAYKVISFLSGNFSKAANATVAVVGAEKAKGDGSSPVPK